MLNLALMRHWQNWALVLIVLLVGSLVLSLIYPMTERG